MENTDIQMRRAREEAQTPQARALAKHVEAFAVIFDALGKGRQIIDEIDAVAERLRKESER